MPEVETVTPAYQTDIIAMLGDERITMRVHSFPKSAAEAQLGEDGITVTSPDDSYLNRLILTEGRWPTGPGECLLSADRVSRVNTQIGDTLRATQGTTDLSDVLTVRTFTIVGKVRTPYYVSSAALDSSSLGSGVVQQFIYVPESTFAESYPITEAFVRVEGAEALAYPGDAYDKLIDAAKDSISSIAGERCDARLESVTETMYSQATTYEGLIDLLEYRLSHTQEEMDDPAPPEWLIMGRDKSTGTLSFTSDARRVDRIASVFPFIFFLVAALVALTTMTRMVDEERMLIGTYKALGYSRPRITSKYLIYALAASGIGSVIGIAILARLLPGVIMNAYAIMYSVPTAALPIDIPLALLSAGLCIAITLVATWFSVTATLRERPAALLLPRAPKAGKRILLERIRPLWVRLSFTWKVTCRNIFRYKKRFIMTVIGIAGCTALLLTGLGLHDAINDIIDVQYGEIINYTTTVATEPKMSDADRAKLEAVLSDKEVVSSFTRARTETMLASGPRASDKRIDVVVPADPEAYAAMKVLRTRVGHEPLALADNPVILNEKLANELGLNVGDTIVLARQDTMGNATSETYEFTISALTENYIYNYLYVAPDVYAQTMGKAPVYNVYCADVIGDREERAAFDDTVSSIRGIKTVGHNDELVDTYRTMLRSVDLIVVVLVVSAAALAFIVLYNLTNINIEERIREIATLKVLGFTRTETGAYIFREIALLALIGAAIGLALGLFLEGFVVTTAEVDQVMFGRSIHPPSFVWAYVLTLVFSGISMLLMLPKLAHVSMVESLKSNE